MFCSRCGKGLRGEDAYCPQCGKENRLKKIESKEKTANSNKKIVYGIGGLAVLIVIGILVLSSIGEYENKGECYECGQYEILNEFISEQGSSTQTSYYCDDCYKLNKMFDF